jgi:hypothetical protein
VPVDGSSSPSLHPEHLLFKSARLDSNGYLVTHLNGRRAGCLRVRRCSGSSTGRSPPDRGAWRDGLRALHRRTAAASRGRADGGGLTRLRSMDFRELRLDACLFNHRESGGSGDLSRCRLVSPRSAAGREKSPNHKHTSQLDVLVTSGTFLARSAGRGVTGGRRDTSR